MKIHIAVSALVLCAAWAHTASAQTTPQTVGRALPQGLSTPQIKTAAPDMTGWVAVTANGAIAAPEILATNSPALIVQGADKAFYMAPVDLLSPKPIDNQSWRVFEYNGLAIRCVALWPERASCIKQEHDGLITGFDLPDGYATSGLNKVIDAFSFGGKQTSMPAFVNFVRYQGGTTFGWGYMVWDGKSGVQATRVSKSLDLDANDKIKTGQPKPEDWRVRTAAARTPLADCVPAPYFGNLYQTTGYCVLSDPATGKLSVVQSGDWDLTLQPMADLPALPGGSGAAQGEVAIAYVDRDLYAFARGANGALYMSHMPESGTFGAWQGLGGNIKAGSIPSCDNYKDGITCAIRGPDNRIYLKRVVQSNPGSGL